MNKDKSRIERIRQRYAHYGETKNLDKNCSVRHIRELLEELDKESK